MKSIKLQVNNEEQEKNRMEQIKRDIAISMYVLLLGIIIVGVNTVLFPFQDTGGYFIFFIEICFVTVYFTILLHKNKIKKILHIYYSSSLTIRNLVLKFIKQTFIYKLFFHLIQLLMSY